MRAKAVLVTVVLSALALGWGLLVPASAEAEPVVPTGWHASSVVVSAGANPVLLEGGVLLIGAWEGSVDAYLLGARPEDPPIRSTLPAVAPSWASSLDRGLLVYFVTRPGATDPYVRDLYLKDLGTEQVVRLTNDTLNHVGPRVDRGRVVWWEWGTRRVPEIMLYDFASSIKMSLTPNPKGTHKEPDISGDIVAWQQWTGTAYRVLFKDLRTGKNTELDNSLPWIRQPLPQVDHGRILWHGRDQGAEVLWVYDIADGSKHEVANAASIPPSRSGVLDGRLVVFRAEDPEQTASGTASVGPADAQTQAGARRQELYVHDLDTGQTLLLAERQSREYLVDDGLVAWEALEPSTTDPAIQETVIRVYDATTGQITELVRGKNYQLGLLDQGRVVFTELLDDRRTAVWLAVKDDAAAYGFYVDVYADDSNYEAIMGLTDLRAVEGTATTTFRTFRPLHPLKRAQFAKMIAVLLGLTVNEDLNPPFTDLGTDDPNSLYPHEYVAAANLAGITKGTTAATFSPWKLITRAQLVTMAVRALEKRVVLEEPPADFAPTIGDFSPVHWPNMRKAEYWGLLEGLEGFGPGWDPVATASRGEAAQVLWNLHTLVTAQ